MGSLNRLLVSIGCLPAWFWVVGDLEGCFSMGHTLRSLFFSRILWSPHLFIHPVVSK